MGQGGNTDEYAPQKKLPKDAMLSEVFFVIIRLGLPLFGFNFVTLPHQLQKQQER